MDWKLYISAFIFVSVTVLKLIFPEETAELRRQAVSFIDMDMDYRQAVVAMGSALTEESVQEVIGTVYEVKNAARDYVVPSMQTGSEQQAVRPEETVTEKEISSQVLARVEAFRLAQEVYSDFETPSNVSYDLLEIPFSYVSPVTGVCSSGFGYRVHPIEGQVLFHYGTDYDVEEGTTIAAFADGVVTAMGEEAGYGKYVCVDHGDGWESLYAHCSEISVASGDTVTKGSVLGKSGSTGRVTGPHLHFELTCNDFYTNPEFFLS